MRRYYQREFSKILFRALRACGGSTAGHPTSVATAISNGIKISSGETNLDERRWRQKACNTLRVLLKVLGDDKEAERLLEEMGE